MERIIFQSKLNIRQLSGCVDAATREIECGSSIAKNYFVLPFSVSANVSRREIDGINLFARQNGVFTEMKIVQIEFRFEYLDLSHEMSRCLIATWNRPTQNNRIQKLVLLGEFVVRLCGILVIELDRGRGVRRHHQNDDSFQRIHFSLPSKADKISIKHEQPKKKKKNTRVFPSISIHFGSRFVLFFVCEKRSWCYCFDSILNFRIRRKVLFLFFFFGICLGSTESTRQTK